MCMEKILKILGVNMSIAMVNVILFSPGLVGMQLSGRSSLETAGALTIIIMSVLVFCLGNYKLLFQKEEVMNTEAIETVMDYIDVLERCMNKKTFVKSITTLLEQIEQIEKKIGRIHELLGQRFQTTEMSYTKFSEAIGNLSSVFYINLKSIINKINVFDQEDYNRVCKAMVMKESGQGIRQTKYAIYQEYIKFVEDSVEDNEQILLKLDLVLFELSKLGSLTDGELEHMTAIEEINELIEKIKFYK